MKRFSSVLLLCFMLCFMAGCGVSDPSDPVVTGDSSAEPSQTEQSTPEPAPIETTPVEYKPITLTEEHIENMQEFLRGCKYVSFMQTMENGYEGQAVYSTTRYSLSVNVEQNVHSISMRYITVDGINREGVGYKIYSDGNQIMVSEDGEWKEADSSYEVLIWDLSSFDNALDVFEYLMHDVQLPVGVEGISTGEFWTFEFTEPADDSILAGIEYDNLLDATYKFTFRNVSDTIRPDSVSVRVGYEIAETQYYVESVIQMNSFGNTKIAMPKVGAKD